MQDNNNLEELRTEVLQMERSMLLMTLELAAVELLRSDHNYTNLEHKFTGTGEAICRTLISISPERWGKSETGATYVGPRDSKGLMDITPHLAAFQ